MKIILYKQKYSSRIQYDSIYQVVLCGWKSILNFTCSVNFLSQQRNNALNICELGYRECQKKKSVVTVSPCSCGYKARKHCRKQFFKFTIFSASGNVE